MDESGWKWMKMDDEICSVSCISDPIFNNMPPHHIFAAPKNTGLENINHSGCKYVIVFFFFSGISCWTDGIRILKALNHRSQISRNMTEASAIEDSDCYFLKRESELFETKRSIRIKPDLGGARRGFVRINLNICDESWPVSVKASRLHRGWWDSCCSFSWSSSRVVCASRYGKVPPSPSSSSGAEKVPPLRQDPRPCGQYVARPGLSGNLFYFASLAGVRPMYLGGPASRLTVGSRQLRPVHVCLPTLHRHFSPFEHRVSLFLRN